MTAVTRREFLTGAKPTHPQHRLAALINGDPQPSGAVICGPHIVTASVAGTVRVCVAGARPGIAIGHWTDPVEELAAAFHAVVAAAREGADVAEVAR